MVLTYLVLPASNAGAGMSVDELTVPDIFEVPLLGKAPVRSAAATELLMVVAGEEVGVDDDEDDEGGSASVVTTTPMFFVSPPLPRRHRGRQLMPAAVDWPGMGLNPNNSILCWAQKNGTGI